MAHTMADPVTDDWEAWLSGWEDYLTGMVAWCAHPVGPSPDPPIHPMPDGPAPDPLHVRLRRCAALKAQLEADLHTQLAADRKWTPAPVAGPGRRVDLSL